MNVFRNETFKFLLCLLLILIVSVGAFAAWVWGILYIDQVCHDPSHAGLIAGFTIGLIIPAGVVALIVVGAYYLADEL